VRVNSRKRHEAYVSLDGFPCDVLFDGFGAQNRAVRSRQSLAVQKWLLASRPARDPSHCAAPASVSPPQIDGDVVAFKLLPPGTWPAVAKGQGDSAQRSPGAEEGPDTETCSPGDDGDDDEDGLEDPLEALALGDGGAAGAPPPSPAGASSPAASLAALRAACVGPPGRRPLGQVVAIWCPTPRREQLVGYLEAPQGMATRSPTAASTPGRKSSPVAGAMGAETPATPPAGGGTSKATPPRDEAKWFWRFTPADPRLPRFNVEPGRLCPDAFVAQEKGALGKTLFIGAFVRWSASASVPLARVAVALGEAGTIETETKALVAEYELPDYPFSDASLACLPQVTRPGEWAVPPQELQTRRDFREELVFTIDPPTARDLDDALSITPLPGGAGYRVGVHIADVSHFVTADSALDLEARGRATSTYLVQNVIPMLPRLLCEELCSLNPCVDRLTYSVVWHTDAEGNIKEEWFGKGVIRSAAKLDYAVAQAVIDASQAGSDTQAPLDAFLAAKAAPAAPSGRMAAAILQMHVLAQKLRSARFANGALRLDNPKLTFALDKETGDPLEVKQYITGQSHQLVEELMLLANRRVAAFIAAAVPQGALLRRHPPPDGRKMDELRLFSAKHGLDLDTSSSGALHASLTRLARSRPEVAAVATLMVTKPMQLAHYFSTADVEDAALWGHYALAMDRYTHFTSPIRRYADLVVHRALSAALLPAPPGGGVAPSPSPLLLLPKETLTQVASHCNARKLVAKTAQEASAQVFLCAMLRAAPRLTRAHVLNTGPKFLHCFLPDYGFEVRVEVEPKDLPRGVSYAPVGTSGEYIVTASPVTAAANAAQARRGRGSGEGEQRQQTGSGQAAAAVGNVEPAKLPLRIAAFSCIPVLLSATVPEGKRSEVQARLHLSINTGA
jgi:DIS3-like exonuclease 2